MTEPDTYSAHEAGARLGVSAWSIYEGVRRGDIPNVARGRRVQIPRVWVERRLDPDAGGITSTPALDVSLVRRLGEALIAWADEEGGRVR